MEILHTLNIIGKKIDFEEIKLEEKDKRNSLVNKIPTTTFPFLETEKGNISQSNAIIKYLCEKYKPELLGENIFEKCKIIQWIEFANNEIFKCNKNIIYPIFGWNNLNKEDYNKDNNKIKEYLKIIEKELENKEYIIGNKISIADIKLFSSLRYLMILYLPEQMRNKLYPKINKWYEKIMNTSEAINAYGRTILCKNIIKPYNGIINKNIEKIDNNQKKGKKDKKENIQKNKEIKKEKEPYIPSILELPRYNIKPIENNILDLLPESKFDLDKFKIEFLKNNNKKNGMKYFWKNYDPDGYSLWFIEYNNDINECITLFRTCIIKGNILEQLKYFKKYCFGVLGVYGNDSDYKIKGCLLWRGNEIPEEIKNIDCYNKLNIRKLDYNQKKDQQLVHDYWTKIGEKEKVFKKPAIDTRYFY
jgi:elongation factor 1-gamma